MFRSLDSFCDRLSASALSQAIQGTEWVIPAVQTVHILAVGAVVTSVALLDLRLAGWRARRDPLAAVAGRYLPVIWLALPVLLLTGATLILAEPSRALQNPVFIAKMTLLVAAVALTLMCHAPLRRDAGFWEASPARRRLAVLIASLSAALWIGIVFAGRWIAYVQSN